jgi:hypothetical protein
VSDFDVSQHQGDSGAKAISTKAIIVGTYHPRGGTPGIL